MTRSRAAVLTAVFAVGVWPDAAAARQPGAQVVGPTGPGLQPQVATGPYRQPKAPAATRGVNPFGGGGGQNNQPAVRFAPRAGGPPVVLAPVPGAPANNPAVFNPGFAAPFPIQVPQAVVLANGYSYNPVFGQRRGVVSGYYVPPYPQSPGPAAGDGPGPAFPEPGATLDPAAGFSLGSGEYRFLPWVW